MKVNNYFSYIVTPTELKFTYFEALEKNGWIMMYETHNEFEVIRGGKKYNETSVASKSTLLKTS